MSRNFELLRRAKEEQALFIQPVVETTVTDNMPVALSKETVCNDLFEVDEREVPRPARQLSGTAENELFKLVRQVFLSPSSRGPRVVCFSSVEGNGAGDICFYASQALAAHASGSVCLVDANLDASSLGRLSGVDGLPGLADALTKSGPIKGYAVRFCGENVWLLPLGSQPGAVTQGLFPSDRLRSRIAELREQFDFVLIDAPPVSSHGDAVVLGQVADGLILVLEANSTRRQTARIAKEILDVARIRILGAILNNRSFPIPESLYRRL